MKFNLAVFLFLSYLTCFSQEILPISTDNDWEVWYDKVPVSGEIRVGIMNSIGDANINPSFFYVMIPNHSNNILQCEISSRDGRYEASISYNIENLKPGNHKFSLPTQHKNELKKYTSKDITILTSIGETSLENTAFYVSASWDPIVKYPEIIYIYINSERKSTIVIQNLKSGTSQGYPCEKIQATSSIAYNSLCKIPTKNLDLNSTLFIKQRVRKMNKITYNRYPITFKLPSNGDD